MAIRTRLWLATRSPVFIFALLTTLAVASTANAQLTFNKSFNPDTIGPGGTSLLIFTIVNPGLSPATNLAFTDSLPAGVTIANPANVTSDCTGRGGTLSAPAGGTTISLSGGSVGAGTSCSISVDVTSSTLGTHTNTSGDLTSNLGNSGPASADLTVATDRPGFSKSFAPSTVPLGGRSTLTFTIDNTANSAGAANLAFSDSLPIDMEVANPANASTTCSGGVITAAPGGGVISYSGGGSVAALSSCTVSVDVVATGTGTLENVSDELTSTPPPFGSTRSSGTANATLTVTASPLSLTKSFTDDPVNPGGSVTLEFTLTNADRSATASNISFTDDLDAVLSGLASTSGTQNNVCGAGSFMSGTSVLSLTGGSLAPGASCTFSVSLVVPATAVANPYVNTTSTVTYEREGQNATETPATDTLFVNNAPSLIKTFLTNPVGGGDIVTVEFTITNTSSTSAATDIAFTDNLDAFLNGTTAIGLPANDICGGGVLTSVLLLGERVLIMSGGDLPISDSCTFSVDLQIPVGAPAGTFTNTTSNITATVDGTTQEGNAASDDLTVVRAPTLEKSFTDDPVLPGDTVTLEFTLSYDENALADATEITFTDNLEAVISGLEPAASETLPKAACGGTLSFAMGELNLIGGTLTPGASCTFNVELDVPTTATSGIYTNTTSEVSAEISGVMTTEDAASDNLNIAGLILTKEFTDDPVQPGDPVTLEFTIENVSISETATAIMFSDDVDATLALTIATSLPIDDVCDVGNGTLSSLSGNRLLFSGATLAAGELCTFSVTLNVPAGAVADTYDNTTSNLTANMNGQATVFDSASDKLLVGDQDNDGVFDFNDNCPEDSNPLQEDADGDGLGDVCDLDGDSDGVDDNEDNCPADFNPGQEDADGDGLGNVCDPTPFPESDADNDGVRDDEDNCPADFNPGQEDVDGDGLGDVCDPDDDNDNVLDGDDVCPGTVIPEAVPLSGSLGNNKYALTGNPANIFEFEVAGSSGQGGGSGRVITTTDTGGCSCEQIIDALGLGRGVRNNGCSLGNMTAWINQLP